MDSQVYCEQFERMVAIRNQSDDEDEGVEIPTEVTEDIVRVPDSQIHFMAREVLGTSRSSIVYTGFFRDKSRPAAVKRVNKDHYQLYKNELKIWKRVNSENSNATVNIVQFLDYAEDAIANAYYFAMELAKMTLHRRVKEGISYQKGVSLIHDAAQGLKWLHSQRPGIIHRDIKPDNILIFEYSSGPEIAKLADFGISRQFSQEDISTTLTRHNGTEFWMAPEAIDAMFKKETFPNKKSLDIFSLGATAFYTVANGVHPFNSSSLFNGNIVCNIQYKSIEPVPLPDSNMVAANNLFRWMMQKEDEKCRPNIYEVLIHPFFWDLKKCLDFIVDIHNSTPNEGFHKGSWNKIWRDVDDAYRIYYEKFKRGNFNWIPVEALPFITTSTERINEDCPTVTVDTLLFKRPNGRKSKYDGNSIRSLIKFIRDKYQHYTSLDSKLEVDDFFGNTEKGLRFDVEKFIKYFIDKYPDIIIFMFCFFANQRDMACMSVLRENYFKQIKGKCHLGDPMMQEISSHCNE